MKTAKKKGIQQAAVQSEMKMSKTKEKVSSEPLQQPKKNLKAKEGKRLTRVMLVKQLVILRKKVKQAKVNVVNKLTKQVAMLEKKKGSEKQLQKNARKLQRLQEEIKIAKKLKRDEVARYAVAETKNLANVINNANTPLDVRAKARVAMFPAFQEKLQKFRHRHPSWEKDVSRLLLKIRPLKPKGQKGGEGSEDDDESAASADDSGGEDSGDEAESDASDENDEELVASSAKPVTKAKLVADQIKQLKQKKPPSSMLANPERQNDKDAESDEGDGSDEEEEDVDSAEDSENGSVAANALDEMDVEQAESDEEEGGPDENAGDDVEDSDEDGPVNGIAESEEEEEKADNTDGADGKDSDEDDAVPNGVTDSEEEDDTEEDNSEGEPDPEEIDADIAARLMQGKGVSIKSDGNEDDEDEDDEDEDDEGDDEDNEDDEDEDDEDDEDEDVEEGESEADYDQSMSEESDTVPASPAKQGTKRSVNGRKEDVGRSKGQMKIKRIKLDEVEVDKDISLDEDDDDDESDDEPMANSKRSSFFMGGVDDDEDEEDDAEEDDDDAGDDVLMQGRRRMMQRQQIRASAAGERMPRGRWRGAERGHRGRFQGRGGGGVHGNADQFAGSDDSPDEGAKPKGKLLRPGYLDGDASDSGDDNDGGGTPRGRGRDRGGFRGRGRGGFDRGGRGMHPSWAAKKSQSPAIGKFEGKKVKFD